MTCDCKQTKISILDFQRRPRFI